MEYSRTRRESGMPVKGERILRLGRRHIGESYVLGSLAPKNNPRWTGPWDCAEFASWLVFQAGQVLYGCDSDSSDPASADAYTGYRSEEHTSELQSQSNLVCRLLLEKKKKTTTA